jgi:transposase
VIADGLLAARVALRREFDRFEKQVRGAARCDTRARLLMSIPGVGAIVSLTFIAAIDDPARFKSSKQVGAYFGLTRPNINRARQTSMAASRKSVMPGCAPLCTRAPTSF